MEPDLQGRIDFGWEKKKKKSDPDVHIVLSFLSGSYFVRENKTKKDSGLRM